MKTPLWMSYVNDMHYHFKRFYAVWLPNDPISLGDFGYLQQNMFVRKGNIRDDFGVNFKENASAAAGSHYTFASEGQTQVDFVAGTAVSPGNSVNAGVKLHFGTEHAVFFDAAGCTVSSVADHVSLNAQILSLFERKIWVDDWHIVTSVVKCGRTLIAVSGGSGASIDFEAQGQVPNVDLADASVRFSAKSRQKIGYALAENDALTPLIGLSALKWKFLKGRNLQLSGKADDFPRSHPSYAEMRRLASLQTDLSNEIGLEQL